MAKLTITEAIKLSPIGKTHFYKEYINTGKITVSVDSSGKKHIDHSELLRVFGELKSEPPVNVHEQPTVNATVQPKSVDSEQRELVQTLKDQISELKADKAFLQSQVVSLTNRLPAPKKQSWFNRFWNAKD